MTPVAHPPTKHVKNFVKDWVAVHSLPTDLSNEVPETSFRLNDQVPPSPARTSPLKFY